MGFEEGGQLTEAVRRKPYGSWVFAVGFLRQPLISVVAVVLLDELEKAHKVGVFWSPYTRPSYSRDEGCVDDLVANLG